MKQTRHLTYDLLCAVFAAELYLCGIFLADILAWKASGLAWVYYVPAAVCYGFLLLSRQGRDVGIKWLLSLPAAYLCLQYFWNTSFALRSLNWVLPGYGRMTAGGAMSGEFRLLLFSGLCLVAVLLGCRLRPERWKHLEMVQLIVGAVLGVGLAAAVVLLERRLPPLDVIYS